MSKQQPAIDLVLEGLSRRLKSLTKQIELADREVEPLYDEIQTGDVFYEIYNKEEAIDKLYEERAAIWSQYQRVKKNLS
jgi:hypothetical protein